MNFYKCNIHSNIHNEGNFYNLKNEQGVKKSNLQTLIILRYLPEPQDLVQSNTIFDNCRDFENRRVGFNYISISLLVCLFSLNRN